MDYANTTNVEFIVDKKVLFHGWLIYSYWHVYVSWSSDCQASLQIGSLTTLWHDHIACIDDTACPAEKRHFEKWACAEPWTCPLKSVFPQLVLFLAHVQGEPIGLSAGVLSVINKSFFLTVSLINYCIYFALHFFALYVLTNINLSPSKQKFLIKLSL